MKQQGRVRAVNGLRYGMTAKANPLSMLTSSQKARVFSEK
jgi:hypothetical protein